MSCPECDGEGCIEEHLGACDCPDCEGHTVIVDCPLCMRPCEPPDEIGKADRKYHENDAWIEL